MARFLILAMVGILGASVAWADIGAVGNPYAPKPAESAATPSAEQKTDAKPEAAADTAKPAQEEQKPLIEIAFDRNYINYAGAINQGVAAAEKAKPGVIYTVVSYLPPASPSSLQTKRAVERAEVNLRAVVGAISQLGVPRARINVATKRGTSDYDVIKVFVE